MDDETLKRIDAEAEKIIESYYADQYTDIENYTKTMGTRLSEAYGAAIRSDQLAEYGKIAEQWVLELMAGEIAREAIKYGGSEIGSALKHVYHDRATGKEAPKPEDFGRMLHISGIAITASMAKAD
jgi:hypothetical protein